MGDLSQRQKPTLSHARFWLVAIIQPILTKFLLSEPVLYWNCVSQLGLFHELTQEIEQQLQVLKTSFGIPELRPKGT